jgi:hypothetical protein
MAPAETDDKRLHWLLVIDHHDARIYHTEMHGSIPEKIMPHEPEAHMRLANDAKDFSHGKDKPAPNSFFKSVAGVLQAGGQILIFGTGTGTVEFNEQHKSHALARLVDRPSATGARSSRTVQTSSRRSFILVPKWRRYAKRFRKPGRLHYAPGKITLF